MHHLSFIYFCVWFLIKLPQILFFGILCIFPKYRRIWYNILVGIDQMGNVILLGSFDETISSRLGRCAVAGGSVHWYVNLLYQFVDWAAAKLGDHNHCIKSIESGNVERHEIWNWITGEVKARKK